MHEPPEIADLPLSGAVERAWDDPLTAFNDPDFRVRNAALARLAPNQQLGEVWNRAAIDPEWKVRRFAVELAAHSDIPSVSDLIPLLSDEHPLVVEATAFALGERESPEAVPALIAVANHEDALVREAVIAALGSIGSEGALDTVLEALRDRPPIRRRAVCALAAFEGDAVEAALVSAMNDRDWQVRQIAEILSAGADEDEVEDLSDADGEGN